MIVYTVCILHNVSKMTLLRCEYACKYCLYNMSTLWVYWEFEIKYACIYCLHNVSTIWLYLKKEAMLSCVRISLFSNCKWKWNKFKNHIYIYAYNKYNNHILIQVWANTIRNGVVISVITIENSKWIKS